MFLSFSTDILGRIRWQITFCYLAFAIVSCVPRSNHPFLEEDQTNPQEILEYLNDVIKADPDNKNALYQKAQILADQENWESALKTINKALKIDFTNNDYFFLKGEIMAALGNNQESVKSFKQAEALGNNSHELYKLLSRSYLALNQPDESRKVVNRLLQLDNGDEAHILAGETLLALNDTIEALNQFNIALDINASNEKALIGMKAIFYGRAELNRVEEILDKLVLLDENRSDFKLDKANLLAARGALDTAKSIVKEVYQSDSTDQVVIQLADLEYQLANYDSVLFYIDKLEQKNDINVLLLNARVLDKKRDYTQSLAVYQSILLKDSTNNIARNELATLRGKMSYLQRLARERAALDSVRNNPPPVLNRREIIN